MAANAIANVIPSDQTYTFTEEGVADETRGGWYVRQLLGAANIEGSPLFRVLSGNLDYQVEHHLYPNMPSSRYAEIAPKIKDIYERFTVHRTIFRLAFPGGESRPKPGPYRSPDRAGSPGAGSEAERFRGRVPAEHPEVAEDSGGRAQARTVGPDLPGPWHVATVVLDLVTGFAQ